VADLLTHWSLAVLVKAGVGWRDVPLFVAGSLLPDLMARLPPLALELLARPFGGAPPWLSYVWVPMHLPTGMLLLGFVLCLLFPVDRRRVVFANLVAGMALHLGVDLLQDHLGVGYQLLFPLWGRPFELGIYGSEDSVWVAPFLSAAALMVWWRRRRSAPAGS
jgi:hypothetical protein